MAFIKLFDFKNASGLLKKEYEKGLRRAGKIWNVLTIQSQTPEHEDVTISIDHSLQKIIFIW